MTTASRISRYDLAVLRWLAEVRVATTWMILLRYWHLHGTHPSHGWRVVQRLAARGLLERRPLWPARGSTSPEVLALTTVGHRETAPWTPYRPVWDEPGWLWRWRLQRAYTLLVRAAEGWELLPSANVGPALRSAALASISARRKTPSDWDVQRALERMRPPEVSVEGIRHRRTGATRLLVPIRPRHGIALVGGISDRASLAHIGDVLPVEIDPVVWDPEELPAAVQRLRRWAVPRRRPRCTSGTPGERGPMPRIRLTIVPSTSIWDLRHPMYWPPHSANAYLESGGQCPLDLVSRAPTCAAHGDRRRRPVSPHAGAARAAKATGNSLP